MDEQLIQVLADSTVSNLKPSIDPLRRVWVPTEKRTEKGTWVFRTRDGALYARARDNSIHRVDSKVNGKQARKLRAKVRRTESKR